MKYINLTNSKKKTIVDDCDFLLLNRFTWYLNDRGYVYRNYWDGKRGRKIRIHKMIVNNNTGHIIDHRNGDKLDNRKSNLRLCTNQENQMNCHAHRDNKSGYKGVYFEIDRKMWRVHIRKNGIAINLGRFRNKKDAAKCYDKNARKLFGEFARTNFTVV